MLCSFAASADDLVDVTGQLPTRLADSVFTFELFELVSALEQDTTAGV
jgi:hypothetical protein